MKDKKSGLLFLFLFIVIFVFGAFCIRFVRNKKQNELQFEYVPEEEISEEQERQTIVSLYFVDKETNLVKPEARLVNARDLVNEPFKALVDLLIDGPKNVKLKSVFPENTELLSASLDKDCLNLDFSVEFLNFDKDDEKTKDNLLTTIVNTVTQLKEVNKVKILVNGEFFWE